MKKILIFLVVIVNMSLVFAKEIEPKKKEKRFFAVPIFGASDEYGIVYGGVSVYNHYSKKDTTKLPNEYQIKISNSSKKQFDLRYNANVIFKSNIKWINEFVFMDYINDFYGVGNNTLKIDLEKYEEKKIILKNELFIPILNKTELIISNTIGLYKINKLEQNGLLDSNNFLGKRDFHYSGLGLGFKIDTCDHRNYPRSGGKIIIKAESFNKILRSKYNFSAYRFEIDRYYSLHSTTIFAFQSLLMTSEGDIPFQNLFYLGKNMRGIKTTRFLGKNLITFRSELRIFPFKGRKIKKIGFVIFSEQGEVNKTISTFNASGIKYTNGAGLRYLLFEKEKINLGFDLGFSKDSVGFNVNFKEAF